MIITNGESAVACISYTCKRRFAWASLRETLFKGPSTISYLAKTGVRGYSVLALVTALITKTNKVVTSRFLK